ncbi:cytochrome P450 [Nocardia donostiensis]|uniref:cytochrome P450 n=1 Tax=Nocardia donostiensis TaxID=1538463 RepID=UPI00349F4629
MRDRYGALVPVELSPGVPATLVIGYREALRILHDPEHFPADPRVWERGVPAGCPVLPMMQWRPNALRTAGVQHARYREANVDALGRVDLHRTHAVVEQIALTHINRLCEVGEADLVGEFAFPVVFDTICALMGCEADVSVQAVEGMAMMFDTVNAARGNELLLAALAELVHRKRACPGEDITSWLISHHTGLDDEELVQQLVTIFGATSEPQTNLIINTLLVMMTGDRFGGSVTGGSLSTRDALDEVLFTDPPMANFAITYPRQPILIGTVWLPPINRW